MSLMHSLFGPDQKFKDAGLLVIRLVIGGSVMIFYGFGKISGGPEMWAKVGGSMSHLGISFLPAFWGFMAAFAEFFGSLLLILGVLFRPAALMMVFTMLVAVITHVNMPEGSAGAGWAGASHALELLGVYVGLYLIGPGKYRVPSRY